MRYYIIRFYRNVKVRELFILANSRYHARLLAIDVIGIHPDSIIQIKEATD